MVGSSQFHKTVTPSTLSSHLVTYSLRRPEFAMPRSRMFFVIIVSLVLSIAASCNRGPGRVKQPGINASQAGKLAMEQYDTNKDGKVAGDELEKAPSLKAALKNLDTDGDGAVSAEE